MKRHGRLLAGLILASAILPTSFTSNTAIASGVVEFRQNISESGGQSEAPQISFGGNRLGASWGERSGNSIGTSRAVLDGAFGERQTLGTGTSTEQQWPDVAVDASGTMHLAYANRSGQILYRRKPVGGSWSNPVSVGGDAFPNPVRIAVAPNGTIWIIWRDTNGTRIGFKFSDNGGTGWSSGSSGGIVAAERGNMFSPDIAIGPDNVPHVVWYIRQSGGDTGEIKYADWDGSRFRSNKLTNDGAGLYDADPAIAIDKSGVQHVVFRKRLDSIGNSWAITYARRNVGGGWSGFTPVSVTRGDAKYAPSIGVDDSGSVYVGYSDPLGNSRTRQIVLAARSAGSSSWSRQTLTNSRWNYRPVIAASSVGGSKAHVLYQEEQQADAGEIVYLRLRFSGAVVNADPLLDANTPFTRNPTATLTFSAVQGNPTQMRWRWGAPPTDQANDSSGWQPFQNPRQINLPIPEGGCGLVTLFTQVRSGDNIQPNAQFDSIIYDDNVQASVAALNPNTSGLTSSFAQGANDGSGGYTRQTAYNFVLNGLDDCGGLRSYQINTGPVTAITGGGAFVANLPFAAQASGVKDVNVVVTDNAGNQQTYNRPILLDLPGDGRPVVARATTTITGGNSLQQAITVTNAQVSDNLYGTAEGLPANKEFWGVLVATSRTQIPAGEINAAPLAWTAVQVRNPAADSFTVNYDVSSGLNINGLNSAAGTYYVYLKFLDGAGNASEWTSDALPVTLAAGYSAPQTFSPIISTAR